MTILKNIISIGILVLTLVSARAMASDFGFEFGFRQQSGSSVTGTTTKSMVGYQLGGVGHFELTEKLNLRTGFFYVQRPLTVSDDATGNEYKYQLNYFDIPLTLIFKLEDYGGVYFGPVLGLNLDSSCSGGCKAENVTSMITPIQIGASFKIASQTGVDIFFETSSGDMAKNLSSYRAVGVNLLFTFD